MITNIDEILERLRGVKQSSNGNWIAYCPSHEDRRNRSLAVTERDGKVLMHCFCGCSFGDIMGALGIKRDYTKPELEAIYDYTDEQGTLLYQALRYFPKTFKQRRPDGNGGHIWSIKDTSRVLFQLPNVLQAIEKDETIFLVEGEKDCLNLGMHNITATTLAGGASQPWLPEYSRTLKNARVAIIPDNDRAGKLHATKTANMLYGWVSSIKMLEEKHLYDLNSNDISDWLQSHGVAELHRIVQSTDEFIPEGAITREEFNEVKSHLVFLYNKLKQRYSDRGVGGKDLYKYITLDDKPSVLTHEE